MTQFCSCPLPVIVCYNQGCRCNVCHLPLWGHDIESNPGNNLHYHNLSWEIAPRSTSFPYLQVAQEHGVSYGLVLSYADLLDLRDGNDSRMFASPLFDESSAWAAAARTAWWREDERRTGGTRSYLDRIRRSFSGHDDDLPAVTPEEARLLLRRQEVFSEVKGRDVSIPFARYLRRPEGQEIENGTYDPHYKEDGQ